MKAEKKVAPSVRERKKSSVEVEYERKLAALQDAIGQIVCEVGIVETLANAVATIAGRVGDDGTRVRRLGELAVQIENAAGAVLATATDLQAKLNPD